MTKPCTLASHRAEISDLLAQLFARAGAAPAETVSIADPTLEGRTTATAVQARLPIPAFTNSQMDGFAVCANDLAGATRENPVTLPLGFAVAAGDALREHLPGTATPVMTGAPVPHGADTIVPVEATAAGTFPALTRAPRAGDPAPADTAHMAPESEEVTPGTLALGTATFPEPSPVGCFVRPAGEDLAGGRTVADAGSFLTPTLIGALAASGITEVPVRSRLRALVCSTGDEVQRQYEKPGAPSIAIPQPGTRIPDANGPMLVALLRRLGVIATIAHVPDQPGLLAEQLLAEHQRPASEVADFIITTGGVSAGAFEVVREALTPLGGVFHSVAMQPGGPQGYAVLPGAAADAGAAGTAIPVLCFPGNPVSAFISAELFLAPELRRFAGMAEPRPLRLPLAHEVESPAAKHQVRRGLITEDGAVTVMPPGSHLVHDLASADVLVHLPIGVTRLAAGAPVETWRLDD